jgi:hypothetical protein
MRTVPLPRVLRFPVKYVIRRTVAASSRYSAGMRRPCGNLRAISIRSVYHSLIHFNLLRISPSFCTRRLRRAQLAQNYLSTLHSTVSMQVMLNILLFFTSFSIATFIALRPKRARQDVKKLVNNLRYVADGLHHKVHDMSMKKPDFGNCGRILREDENNLLTK